jgi:hypothetical protein
LTHADIRTREFISRCESMALARLSTKDAAGPMRWNTERSHE